MPNISASDYTQYVKYKAAQVSYANGRPPRAIQTVDQVSPNINIINSMVKTSQASLLVDPTKTNLRGLNYVRAIQPEYVNHPNALSTVTWNSMSMGTTSSKIQQPGGLPAKNVVGTYTRLPQNAGWIQGGAENVSSGPKRF